MQAIRYPYLKPIRIINEMLKSIPDPRPHQRPIDQIVTLEEVTTHPAQAQAQTATKSRSRPTDLWRKLLRKNE